jgi:phosphinothricin acetyltransferase
MIRKCVIEDASQICNIYNPYITDTSITFEQTPVSEHEMQYRISELTASLPWYVFEQNGTVLGFSYASKWKGRCAYRYSVELTVYVSQDNRGKGIGKLLYQDLIDRLKCEFKMHAIMAGIALPNEASIALHERFGFQKVAHFKEVGFKFDKLIDVGYWELLLQ